MAKPKRKTLPKDFGEQLKTDDLPALKAIFDSCALDARGGAVKQTALAFACPDALTRWLVEQGADLHARDTYGETPLHAHARHWQGRADLLIELGAAVNDDALGRGTPLHMAAGSGNAAAVRALLRQGADPRLCNKDGVTPLKYALQRCSNAKIAHIAEVAAILLDAAPVAQPRRPSMLGRILGAKPPAEDEVAALKALVTRIGTEFEFHRASFNPDYLAETSAGLERLYALLDVTPVPKRLMHDGKAPIVAGAARWEDRFEQLWKLLVPSSGAAPTVQGETIRIAGRIGDEIDRNGGVNWDGDYRKMADAFLANIASGNPLPDSTLEDVRANIAEIKKRGGDTQALCRVAVEWVNLNPQPIALPKPQYDR